MLKAKRPGTGMSPQDMESVVGRKAAFDILDEDIILQYSMFE